MTTVTGVDGNGLDLEPELTGEGQRIAGTIAAACVFEGSVIGSAVRLVPDHLQLPRVLRCVVSSLPAVDESGFGHLSALTRNIYHQPIRIMERKGSIILDTRKIEHDPYDIGRVLTRSHLSQYPVVYR